MSDESIASPEPEEIEENTSSSKALSDEKVMQPVQKRTGSIFAIMLSFICLIALAALAYTGYTQLSQLTNRLNDVESSEQNVQAQISKANADLSSELKTEFQGLQSKIALAQQQQQQNASAEIASLAEQLALVQNLISSQGTDNQDDWMLAEADYLIRFASNRLLFDRDVVTTLTLLHSADKRLQQLDDSSLQAIRAALARDMAALRALPKEDVAGTALRLTALFGQIKLLPIHSFQLPDAQAEQTSDTSTQSTEAEQGWWQNFKENMNELAKDWFNVRHHGREVMPLMDAEQESVIRTNLSVLLQNAQYAILKQHTELYHQSFQQIKLSLNTYFDNEDTQVIAFVSEIDSLDALIIKADIPSSLESQPLISKRLSSLTGQQTPATSDNSGEQQ